MKAKPSVILAIALGSVAIGLSVLATWRSFQSQPVTATAQAAPSERAIENSPQLPDKPHSELKRSTTEKVPAISRSVSLPVQDATLTKDELEAEAQSAVDRLLIDMPDLPQALHVSAMLNAQLHKTEQAMQLWSKCIELDPEPEQYYVNLAALAIERGESQVAIATLEKAVSRGIKSVDVLHHLCVSLLNAGRVKEAAETAQSALQAFPQSGAHWLVLGQSQLKLGDLQAAETSLRTAIDLGAQTKAAYFSLFNVCLRLGKQTEAKQFRETYAAFSDQEINAQQRFTVLSESEARRVCVTTHLEAAALYRAAKQLQDAEFQLLRVLDIDTKNITACQELALIYGQSRRYADELVLRERLLQIDQSNLMNYLFAAKASANGGDAVGAEAYIKRAISMDPRAVIGYAAMAEFLLEQRQPAKAVGYVKHLLALEPSRDGLKYLARALRESGNEIEALAAEEAARKFTSQPAAPNSHSQ